MHGHMNAKNVSLFYKVAFDGLSVYFLFKVQHSGKVNKFGTLILTEYSRI